MKAFLSKLYIMGFMCLTIFFIFLIWKVTFGHIVEEFQSRKKIEEIKEIKKQEKDKAKKSLFKKAILDSEERVKLYLGYRVLEQRHIEGHFHHIDFDIGPDKRSYCVTCHGDVPHDKVKELRAFGNMHASFIACETCHVRLEKSEKTGVFQWYDRETGEIVDTPVREGSRPGTYGAKIIPFERINEKGELQRIDNQERIDFAREYREAENRLTELQKSKARKIIHKIVSKTPYICEDCHQKDAALLPFEDLGYSLKRIDFFVSTEVVGMIKNYTKFYMPRILHPGTEEEKQG